jgi:DNA repair protein RadC
MSAIVTIDQLPLLHNNRFEGLSVSDLSLVEQDTLIGLALSVLSMRYHGEEPITSPAQMRDYLRLRFGKLEHEVFSIVLLDNRHRLIDIQEMFRGTIDGSCVYPREVVKVVLTRDAAAVAFVHNHPSGITDPSVEDKRITETLRDALLLVGVRVLDHIIVSHESSLSFAERGLL